VRGRNPTARRSRSGRARVARTRPATDRPADGPPLSPPTAPAIRPAAGARRTGRARPSESFPAEAGPFFCERCPSPGRRRSGGQRGRERRINRPRLHCEDYSESPTARAIERCPRSGVPAPRLRKGYTSTAVRKLLSRGELIQGRIATRRLDRHEWWLPEL